MIKVMIVDDEPYIRQGLKIIIDWEHYGFDVCAEAANAHEAIKIMKNTKIDLVITDIKMPEMDGLELAEYTREYISENIRFILLSGFYEFEYAKKAIKYGVADYILKPVKKEELIKVLEEYKEYYYHQIENQKKKELSDKIIFERHMSSLVSGMYSRESVDYVKKYLGDISYARYIRIEYDPTNDEYNLLPDIEKAKEQNKLYEAAKTYHGSVSHNVYIPQEVGNDYPVGFIYTNNMADMSNLTEKEFIKNFHSYLSSTLSFNVIFFIGQKVDNISLISESYKSAIIAKNFQLYSKMMDIAFYDEIKDKINTDKYTVDKKLIDELIKVIEENDTGKIEVAAECLYRHFKELVAEPEMIKISMDYFLFSLISLAKDIYPDFDQEEVYKMISQGGYGQNTIRGSVNHLKKFALEFSDYISSLRKYTFGGVLTDIEREITENYMQNLSLKSLSEKYYINSAYLGQIFKKQYGLSFKDYLNNYRIEKACEMLLRTDMKIYEIAEAVGFNNTDYFISKFVQVKKTTPLQYRKQFLNKLT